jgi:CRISPR-associated endonuclease Csn1
MQKILGLDLGTNSIGWAVVDKENGTFTLQEKGVQIYPEGVKQDQGNEVSRAAERTDYRSARRLKFRRKLRKYETLKVLIEYDMCPLAKEAKEVLEKWRNYKNPDTGKIETFKHYPKEPAFLQWLNTNEQNNKNPYYFRDKFSRKKYDFENDQNIRYQIGRAFYHLAQRRGFASNRKDDSSEDKMGMLRDDLKEAIEQIDTDIELNDLRDIIIEKLDVYKEEENKKVKSFIKNIEKTLEKKQTNTNEALKAINSLLNDEKNMGDVKKGISELSKKINEANCITLGQYFYLLYQKDRNKPENKIRKHYTDREQHYLNEFKQICKKQEIEKYKPDLMNKLKKAIFYQRPLQSQKGLVGACSFEPSKPRCPVSHPLFEEYRMYHFLNNIKIKTKNEDKLRALTEDEKENIKPKFFRKSKPTFYFKELADQIFPDKNYVYYKDYQAKNYEQQVNFKGNTTVSGCPITAQFMEIFGKEWAIKKHWKSYLYQHWNKKEKKNGNDKTEIEVINDIWHALFYADIVGDKKEIINKSPKEKLKEFAEHNTQLDNEQTKKFSHIKGLKKDYANLSLNAIIKILPYLKKGLLYSHAVFIANLYKVVDKEIWENQENRKHIQDNIISIIDNHLYANKIYTIINAQLAECREEEQYYSREAENQYKKNIEERLKDIFGKKSWQQFPDKEEVIRDALELFTQQHKKNHGKGEFITIKRVDEKVKDFLRGKNNNGIIYCINSERLKNLYHPSDISLYRAMPLKDDNGEVIKTNESEVLGLGSPIIPSVKNPVAMKTLHQLRKIINTLLKKRIIDHNTKVHIELARELNDANKRKAIKHRQSDLRDMYEKYRNEIKLLYKEECNKDIEPTEDEILKYKLWKEQEKKCMYTGKSISICDFIGPNPAFDIEHTIPRSISIDNSQENKTLCYNKYNREIKGNKLPTECPNFDAPKLLSLNGKSTEYPAIKDVIKKWKKKYEDLDDLISILVKTTRAATTKEQKDKKIQQRHFRTLERDYWKGKYDRFTMKEVTAGFKNSQKVDTGIITKYAREYLNSVFNNVYAVNGKMVAAFRKAWGLQNSYKDEFGRTHYEQKYRGNHIHHCMDAITIACMTKEKYDTMAHAWGLMDEGKKEEARKSIEKSKPWKTFVTDIEKLPEEVLIVHYKKDNVPKQTKKKMRERGKIVHKAIDENGNYMRSNDKKKKIRDYVYAKDKQTGNPIPVKGKKLTERDLTRLKEGRDYFTVYKNGIPYYYKYVKSKKSGKFVYKKEPVYKKGDTVRGSLHKDTFYGAIADKDKNGQLKKDKKGNIIPTYVVRKELEKLKQSDVDEIVDKDVKKIIKKAVDDKIISFNKQGANVKETVWRNYEKQIPIKKVRIHAKPSEPLKDFKKHKDISKHIHKQQYHVVNDGNYCMAIYESKGGKRDNKIVTLMEAGNYFKLSNIDKNQFVPQSKDGCDLKCVIKKGQMIILYDKSPDEIWRLSDNEKLKYLYVITQIDKESSCIKLLYHQEAREKKELTKHMGLKVGMKGGKNIGKYKDFPWIKLGVNNFDALVEGVDFIITPIGEVQKIS